MSFDNTSINEEKSSNKSTRRSVLRKLGATTIAGTSVLGLSADVVEASQMVNQFKVNENRWTNRYYRPNSEVYDGTVAFSVNKRSYYEDSNSVTYNFDITSTHEAIEDENNDPYISDFGFRYRYGDYDSPITADPIANPEQSERVQSGVALADNYDEPAAAEATIETVVTELLDRAGYVASRYITVGSLLWALYKAADTSANENGGEMVFNGGVFDGREKDANLSYEGLEFTLGPNETGTVIFEGFTDSVGFEHTTEVRFDLDDHL